MSVVSDFSLKLGSFQLNFAELKLPEVGITVLTGSSGVGKTSVLRSLVGLQPEAKWQWNHLGRELSSLPFHKRGLGYAGQEPMFFPDLSLQKQVDLVFQARGQARLTSKDLSQYVQQLGLEGLMNKPAKQLSGGEAARANLLRALASAPDVLLLDEPFAHLDHANEQSAQNLVSDYCRTQQIPCLLVSHDLEELKGLSELVYEIYPDNKGVSSLRQC